MSKKSYKVFKVVLVDVGDSENGPELTQEPDCVRTCDSFEEAQTYIVEDDMWIEEATLVGNEYLFMVYCKSGEEWLSEEGGSIPAHLYEEQSG